MTLEETLSFIKKHGIVLESAKGPVPNLANWVAGESIVGGWWGHTKGKEIFNLTRQVRESPEILTCRLIDDKITYVHRRIWPALMRLSQKLYKRQISKIWEIHTPSGKHKLEAIPFPEWVPEGTSILAKNLTESVALKLIGEWILS